MSTTPLFPPKGTALQQLLAAIPSEEVAAFIVTDVPIEPGDHVIGDMPEEAVRLCILRERVVERIRRMEAEIAPIVAQHEEICPRERRRQRETGAPLSELHEELHRKMGNHNMIVGALEGYYKALTSHYWTVLQLEFGLFDPENMGAYGGLGTRRGRKVVLTTAKPAEEIVITPMDNLALRRLGTKILFSSMFGTIGGAGSLDGEPAPSNKR